jgi:cyclophilin family peptidyl-prolyl cis-trans isomerase
MSVGAQEVSGPVDSPQSQPQAPKTELQRADKALITSGQPVSAEAEQAKAAFQQKFDEYKQAIREIEKRQVEFQSADAATRQKLNTEMAAQVAHAQSLVNAMVDAAATAYRAAPNGDPQVTDLLASVARYYTIGQQIGPPAQSKSGDPRDVYIPIDGGDQYERALPIIKLLVEKGCDKKELLAWGFLSAFMTNDYDLAAEYRKKAEEQGGLESIADAGAKGATPETQSGLAQNVAELIASKTETLDEYRDLWAKEQTTRDAEAKADDLPRVKLTTTKGTITLELFENEAPETVANFLTLVKQGYYDGSPFHRVLPGFMAQGGAKDDEGGGGPGYRVRCECYRPDYRRHFRGTLSMANTGQRDTGSSQFFLTFVQTPHLNGRHTAFGRVVEGMEVLGDLQHRSTMHEKTSPKADKILKAEVIRDRGHAYKFERLPG